MSTSHSFKRRQILLIGGAGAVGVLGGTIATAEVVNMHTVPSIQLTQGYQVQGDESYLNPGTFNQQFLAKTADVKQIWDFTTIEQIQTDGTTAIKNALNDFQFIYHKTLYPVIDLRGHAVIYALDDAMWSKYRLGTLSGQNYIDFNPLYRRFTTDNGTLSHEDSNSFYQDPSLHALQQRGMQIAVCHQALKANTAQIAQQHGLSAQSVFAEWIDHLVQGVQQTPSGSSLIAVAQHLGFTYAKQ